jgi:pilus assembly protein CpaB
LFFWKKGKERISSSVTWKNKVPEFAPLIVGVLLTLLAVFVARQRISAVEKNILGKAAPRDIVVAAHSISAGGMFLLENLAKKSVPSAGTSRRNVTASDFELLLGARAKIDISEGEPVLWTDVEEPFKIDKFSLTIPIGRRAITIDADRRASFSGLIRPGDHVDILREGQDGKEGGPILFDVPVIAVDRHFLPLSSEEEGNDIGTITVSVTPDEAPLLSAAARVGNISCLLRNPGDRGRPQKRRKLWAKISSPFEIWKAGIREWKPPSHLRVRDLE